MKPDGYVISKHRTILGWYERQEQTLSSKIIDKVTWLGCYRKGYREPKYPVPSIYCFSLISKNVDVRACDINITDMLLSLTGGKNG